MTPNPRPCPPHDYRVVAEFGWLWWKQTVYECRRCCELISERTTFREWLESL